MEKSVLNKIIQDFNNYDEILPMCIRRLIEENPEMDWNWKVVSEKFLLIHMDISFLAKHSDKPWDWNFLSQGIPLENIEMFPYLPWNWQVVLREFTTFVRKTKKDW